jgi:NitT/TauT family transport system permease protein
MNSITGLRQLQESADIASVFWPDQASRPRRFDLWRAGLVVAAIWAAAAGVTLLWPDLTPWSRTRLFAAIEGLVALAILGLALVGGTTPRLAQLRYAGRWLIALPVLLTVWQIFTAKTGILPLPFFPPPQSILEVYTDDASRLLESVVYSMLLLLPGYAIGGVIGFVVGVSVGWSREIGYWGHPILRFAGPLPAVAWLPVAFFFFPGTTSASTFLVALSTGFPVAILTSSGVSSVNSGYYDIARTLGASRNFLIRRVAIPAAMPHVFVGLFMGLGASFAVLIVAEMMGVKAGLGWYLQWAQGWAAYANLYGALILMAALFSGLIGLLFKIRDRALSWQKGTVRW